MTINEQKNLDYKAELKKIETLVQKAKNAVNNGALDIAEDLLGYVLDKIAHLY